MGANLTANGATFRVWAPGAQEVFVNFDDNWTKGNDPANLLVKDSLGYWAGFIPGIHDGTQYKFWIVGAGSSGYKRDPYARELTSPDLFPRSTPFPFCNCVVRNPGAYPWHDEGYRTPSFSDLIIYQLHVGTFFGPKLEQNVANFLDILDRLDYLAALGVNAIEPLPVVEFSSPRSMGYDGSDLFSPEMDFCVPQSDISPYLHKANELLGRRGFPPLTQRELVVPVNQLKVLVDLCHVYGMAVILDVVYNHAGFQIGGQDESLWFFDRAAGVDNPNNSLYFTDQTHTGPVFAIWKREVRQFLIDNARFFITEYHIDGLRYDQVSVIVAQNSDDGWPFCQALTGSVRAADPTAVQVAEYWNVDPFIVRSRQEGGAGFDATWHDGLRESVRAAIVQASRGRDAHVDLDSIARNLRPPGFPAAWKAVQYVESHDEVYKGREPRIAALSDSSDHRSWYARSRARVATGVILTAPGIPMLFMGQEFLEDKNWSDNPTFDHDTLISWEGLEAGEKPRVDHLRFTRELVRLRVRHPALRGESINVFHVHSGNRVIAFHRWLEQTGRDVVVVASLNESTYHDYRLGFPTAGRWLEVFNSDVYDNWVNPWGAGNGGGINVDGPPFHDLPHSASVVIPANSLLVFARDAGD